MDKRKSKFGKALKHLHYPYHILVEQVDLSQYNLRKLKHIFPQPNIEMQVINVGFRHRDTLAINSKPYYIDEDTGKHLLNEHRLRAALQTYVQAGYLIRLVNHTNTNIGARHPTVYQRTPLFVSTFGKVKKMYIKKSKAVLMSRIVKIISNYIKSTIREVKPIEPISISHTLPYTSSYSTYSNSIYPIMLDRYEAKQWQYLKIWWKLKDSVTLSRADGVYVNPTPEFNFYTKGCWGTGNSSYMFMEREYRPLLLIDGEDTAGADCCAMFPNIDLNTAGLDSDDEIYEKLLRDLGLRVCKWRRSSIKLSVLASLNNPDLKHFSGAITKHPLKHSKQQPPINTLGVKPTQILKSINKLYPELHACTGKQATRLMQIQWGIIREAMEKLAVKGIFSLPEFDSLITKKKHVAIAAQVLADTYQRRMGHSIKVKIKG
jgi:hypothetical protein